MSKKETEAREKAEKKPLGPPKSVFREYFESLVVTLIMAIFGMTFILQAVTVPTGSMQNTILVGDYLLVNKFIYASGGTPLPFLPQREIERGDIIVFKFPGYPEELRKSEIEKQQAGPPFQINFVKRVVGLPGDTVEVRDNHVFINGQILPEHRVFGDVPAKFAKDYNDVAALEVKEFEERQPDQKYDVYYSEDDFKSRGNRDYTYAGSGKPYKIPADSYFVMGDSRDRSLDSRFWGVVDRDLIIGRAMFVYWSCDRAESGGDMFGCITNPRFDRIGKMIK
jgi:signal peptidase I